MSASRLAYRGPWYFTVWKDFVLNSNISMGAKIVFIALKSFCNRDGDTAFPGMNTLAVSLKTTVDTVRKYMEELRDLDMLEIEQENDPKTGRWCRNFYTIYEEVAKNHRVGKKPTRSFSDSVKVATKNTHTGKDYPKGIKKTHKRVSKSKCTFAELQQYMCEERGLKISDAEYAFNHWEANGWFTGKKRIRDWKACVRSWQAGKFFPSQKSQGFVKTRAVPNI